MHFTMPVFVLFTHSFVFLFLQRLSSVFFPCPYFLVICPVICYLFLNILIIVFLVAEGSVPGEFAGLGAGAGVQPPGGVLQQEDSLPQSPRSRQCSLYER